MSTPGNSLYERIGGRTGRLKLLRFFYADVRQHTEIAPIFAAHIEDWPSHLEKLADFWSGILGGPRLYSGAMPMKHIPLRLEERHFAAWLGLWSRHSQAHFAAAEARELIAAAETIGQRLRQILAQSAPAAHQP